MTPYKMGMKDGMLGIAKTDLESVAMRIAILEDELEEARRNKWDIVKKISLLESDCDPETILEHNERLTVSEKIALIKEGFNAIP